MEHELTPEELDTLRLLSQGHTLREIAYERKMDISEFPRSTVYIQNCVTDLRKVFKAKNATQLVYKAAKKGLI